MHARRSEPLRAHLGQCSRLKSPMPFKRDLALQNIIPLSKHFFEMQPQFEIEDIT